MRRYALTDSKNKSVASRGRNTEIKIKMKPTTTPPKTSN